MIRLNRSAAAWSAALMAEATARGIVWLTGHPFAPGGGQPRWAQPFTARSTLSSPIRSGSRNSQQPPFAPGRVAISPALASMAVTRRTTTGLVGMEAASSAEDTAVSGLVAPLWAI